MRSAHVPMKVLGLEIEGKYIRKQGVQCSSNILDGLRETLHKSRIHSLID